MSSNRYLRRAAGVAVLALLAACSGNGGGRPGPSGSGGDPVTPPPSPPPPPPPPPSPGSTYSIGGTVSGLSGSGLVLLSSTGETLSIDANGAFAFPTALASGTAFNVTVGTQPIEPPQTCDVSAGTGTIEDANVTNITVVCTADTYTVGGIVTGLSGTGMVLNNGWEQVTVNANGSFVFPTGLTPGAAYDVAVDNAPAKPAQRCIVTDGSGAVSTANVANVSIACETHYPSFAYSLNRADGTMSSFAIDAATGQLRPGLVTPTGHGPIAAVTFKAANDKHFRYVVNQDDDTISAFALGVRSGEVVEVSGSPFTTGGTAPKAALLHPTQPFLYVPNEGGSSIAVFRIDAMSGALTSVGPVATGAQPQSLLIEADGRFAYVAAAGSSDLYTYSIDQTTGALTEVPASRVAIGTSSGGITFERQGRFLYAFQPAAGTIAAFVINPVTGVLAPIAGSPFGAGANATLAALHPNGRYIYVKHPASGGLSAFTIDSATGALARVQGSPFDSTVNPLAVTFDPTGRYLYAGHSAGGLSFDLRAYAVDPATGALSVVSGGPFATPSAPSALNVDASGNYLYVTHESSSQLSSYRIHPDSGALTALPTSPAAVGAMPGFIASEDQPAPLSFVSKAAYITDGLRERLYTFSVGSDGTLAELEHFGLISAPGNVALDPLGRFMHVPNGWDANILAFSVDADTGSLTRLPDGSFPAITDPYAIKFAPSGQFAYVSRPSQREIQRFVVDSNNGTLSSPVVIATPGDVTNMSIHPNGKHLYITSLVPVGGGLNEYQIQTYDIDGGTGTLSASTTEVTQGWLRTVLLDPSGRYAYANDLDANWVRMFSVDPQDGSLDPLPGISHVDLLRPDGIAMDPGGKFLFVTSRSFGTVTVYGIEPDGYLTAKGSYAVGADPIAVAVDASGRWLYVSQSTARTVVTFEIDRNSAALTLKQITTTVWQIPNVHSPLTLSSYTR